MHEATQGSVEHWTRALMTPGWMNSPIETSKSAKQSGKGIVDDQLVGVTKAANNYNNLVKGSSTRQKLQNSKGNTESPEFSPALGINYFREEVCRYKFEVN